MSYILQALKRAQDERESGVVAPRPPRPATVRGSLRHSWWAWAMVAALLINAGILLVFFPSERIATRVDPEGDGSRGDRGPVTGPSAPTAAAPPSPTGEFRDGRGRPRPPESPRLTDSPGAPGRAAPTESRRSTPTGRSEPAPRVGLTQPIESSPRAAESPASEPTAPVRVPLAPAPPSVPAPGSPASSPRVPTAAPVREAFQALTLQALVYSDLRSQRMVFISGRKYVEGDPVAGGFVLEQITPEGAVLSADGEQFLLQERTR